MNALDRVIGYFSPVSGLRRAAARISLDHVRNYDGAMFGRRTAGWRSSTASANVLTKGALPTLRARSRDVSRNTWWGARVKTTVVSHAVGAGIMPKPNTGNKALDKRIKKAWKKWGKHCDAEGQLHIDGLIALATGCIVESGEVLGRMVGVSINDVPPGVVPLEFQLLEPDHLDASRDRVMTSDTIIDQGIEYTRRGKRRGYWIHPTHPGARGLVMPSASVRVAASDMLHAYRKDRIGQGRGVPWVAPVLLKGRDVADLEEAVVVKSRIEACLAAFVETTDASRTIADKAKTETGPDGAKRRIEALSPGMINYLEPGEKISTVAPTASVQFESVLMSNWLTLAAGAGITYDQLTGDLRGANFSSLRAGKIEFRRMIEQFQHHTLVAMLLEPLWDRWTEAAQDAGILPRRAVGYPVEWIMPANEPIDPLKDMQADVMAVRTGRMTWPQFVAAWGLDPDTQLDEIEEWFKDVDRRKIALDTDPRRPAISPKAIGKGDKQTEDNTDDNPAKP
ncbi:MAG: phage portal protein [Afipia sp.]|nr:phage portal protein [Afipia sp.]